MLSHTRLKKTLQILSLHFVPSLQSTFCTWSTFCIWSAFCSLQSEFCTNRYPWHQYSLYNKLSYACILIGPHLWYIGGQTYRWWTFFNSLLYKTNRFQVDMCLFSNRSQRTSKCGKNISDTLGCASCATFLFWPHFDVICDLLLNRYMATWNLFDNHFW